MIVQFLFVLVFFFLSQTIVQRQSVWKELWGSLWLEMKIAFGNPTKRINFDFISGSFSKLIINLPAGCMPSTCTTCLVSEGGSGPCETSIRELQNHWGWKKPLETVLYESQIYIPLFKTSSWSMPQQSFSICANFYSEQHFCLGRSLSMCLSPI